MATIKIVLDQRRAKKDETYPVVIRVRHFKNYFDLKTNYFVSKNQFNEKRQQIISNSDANFEIEELKKNVPKEFENFKERMQTILLILIH